MYCTYVHCSYSLCQVFLLTFVREESVLILTGSSNEIDFSVGVAVGGAAPGARARGLMASLLYGQEWGNIIHVFEF